MYCPRCHSVNDSGNQYCQNCGLDLRASRQSSFPQQSPAHFLWVYSLRFVVMLFALWITRSLLTGVSFVRELNIPNFPLTTVLMINLLVFGFIIFLLIQFAVVITRYWPAAFPKVAGASSIFTAILYVILLSQLYRALLPVLQLLTRQSEPVMLLQVLLLVIALVLVVRALIQLYNHLPFWFAGLRVEPTPPPPAQVAPTETNPNPAA